MKPSYRHLPLAAVLAALVAVLAACSTKKNTASTRFWHSFTARYNTYYNGHEAYKAGVREKERAVSDNYTERLPLFIAANDKVKSVGKGNFETAVTKSQKAIQLHSITRRPSVPAGRSRTAKMRAYLNRKEYNPFLKNAWMLMGQAQFQKAEFLEAASTFAYITRRYAAEPLVAAEARLWLARCYAQLDWYYDAGDALAKAAADSLPARLRREREATEADLLLRQGQLAEALPLLERTARREKHSVQRARLYFLCGQVHTALGHSDEAYRAYGRCIRQNPPYVMAFNARIAQAQTAAGSKRAKSMLRRLNTMAHSPNNKDYLDQVYYAIGNIHLAGGDTLPAITAYERGRAASTRNGIDKGVLLLRLGELYWQRGRYDLAQPCYGEAVGLLDKTYPGHDEIVRRSGVLDALVPHTSAIYLQDSLLALSVMSDDDRNAAIDRVIAEVKRREEAERRARADSLAEARRNQGGDAGGRQQQDNSKPADGAGEWYFYNPQMVQQGKTAFRRLWGQRKNEDDWRRANRSVLALDNGHDEYDYDADTLALAADSAGNAAPADSLAADSAAADPHTRAYYMAQIPFSAEAKDAAHAIIQEALYQAGIIEKDQLEDFPLAAATLLRLEHDYPKFDKREDLLYQLFLLYSRWQRTADADAWRNRLAQEYPDGAPTRLITDPQYLYKARHGREIEDSLYTNAYAAYRRRDNGEVERLFRRSTEEYPNGLNRPKFIFVHAMSRLGYVPTDTVVAELRHLATTYPKSDVATLAGAMVKGLESGRTFSAEGFDPTGLWSRRTAVANAEVDAAGRQRALSDERNVPFVCLIAYPTDSLADGKVLYELAHFNFTAFMLRNFEIQLARDPMLTQFRITGFRSYDEAHAYAQRLYADPVIAARLKGARLFLISAQNLDLIGTVWSFDDYARFYDAHFAPLVIDPALPLDMPSQPVDQHYEDEYTPEELDELDRNKDKKQTDDDGGEWYVP